MSDALGATKLLRRLRRDQLPALRRDAVDAATLAQAADIVDQVRRGGLAALRQLGQRFGDLAADDPIVVDRAGLADAFAGLSSADQALLVRTADRIAAFAKAQRDALSNVDVAVPGGRAGHTVAPVQRAGCYAPGGRFPLPSSVLMTAVTGARRRCG